MKNLSILAVTLLCCISINAQKLHVELTENPEGISNEISHQINNSKVSLDINDKGDTYILAKSSNGRNTDCLIIKLNANGDISWTKAFGGDGEDIPTKIIALKDGGCAITGYTNSNNGSLTGHHGIAALEDGFIAKLDDQGNVVWANQYEGSKFSGSPGHDRLNSIIETKDGNLIAVGKTHSNKGDHSIDYDRYYVGWVLKTDMQGNVISSTKIRSTNHNEYNPDLFTDILEVYDASGYVAIGETRYFASEVNKSWIVKFDDSGKVIWQAEYDVVN